MNRTIICVLLIGFSASASFSQNSQEETVILYNSEAVKVDLSPDGKILAIKGSAPNYMAGYDMKKDALPEWKSIDQPVAKGGEVINAHYSIISKERILLDYPSGFATLQKDILTELNSIAARLRTDPSMRLLLTSHTSNQSLAQTKLAKNRIDSIKMYLKIKGVSEDRIKTETHESPALSDNVAVNFLN